VNRVVTGDGAGILDGDFGFELPLARLGTLWRDRDDFKVLVVKGRIAETEAEWEQRFDLSSIIMPVSDPDPFFVVCLAVERLEREGGGIVEIPLWERQW